MRIISGHCKGRKLVTLTGRQIRPTSDRTREAVFNILGQKVKQAKVLDLFAGTGAMGLEALSRGADHTTFIDLACGIIHQNLKRCRLEDKSTVICCNILTDFLPGRLKGQRFDLVFIDPPYGKGYIEQTLEQASFADLINENGIIIAEQACKESLNISCPPLGIYRQKKYSKTMISFITNLTK
ncbi:16S rRNA (guanine(966)-N(2))-methyltransferase RsmD [Desulfobacula sp.]|uniref:16S rRNA (guanine(966)-N(2))-methyltransferase RsmD n=1 Tax=Desulfobacula sp. TaxID=2593537 RepID=UPI00260A316E|nr:16S rRNA (guanine(966)-N(2))-methyltransferase RsmD [Desulfobacula sp.]